MINKLKPILKTFLISVVVAFFITNKNNFVYTILNFFEFKNEILQKTILSVFVTFVIEVTLVFFSFCVNKVSLFFSKMKIRITVKNNNIIKEEFTFKVINKEYISENIELEIILTPHSKFINFLIKKQGISLEIYFNPAYLDIFFKDTLAYKYNKGFEINDRTVVINLLDNLNINGELYSRENHILNEKFQIQPIRLNKNIHHLDYAIISKKNSVVSNFLAKKLIAVECNKLKIYCEEEE